MVTRHRFVEKQRLGSAPWVGFDPRRIDVKNSWTRAVRGSGPILRRRRSFAKFFDGADFKGRVRYAAEKFRQLGGHRVANGLVAFDEVAAVVVTGGCVRCQVIGKLFHVTWKSMTVAHLLHFLANPYDLLHAQLKDFFRSETDRKSTRLNSSHV